MSIVSAGDIFKLCTVAFKLWEFAFSKVKNAGNLFPLLVGFRKAQRHCRKYGATLSAHGSRLMEHPTPAL